MAMHTPLLRGATIPAPRARHASAARVLATVLCASLAVAVLRPRALASATIPPASPQEAAASAAGRDDNGDTASLLRAIVAGFEIVEESGSPLRRLVTVRVDRDMLRARAGAAAAARIAVSYAPARNASALPQLWTPAATAWANGSWSNDAHNATGSAAADGGDGSTVDLTLRLARLRPARNYTATLWIQLGGDAGGSVAVAVASVDFASFASACAAMDRSAAANVIKGPATWDVLLTPWVEPACGNWEGLVGLDAEGFIVWWYKVETPGPADQMSDGSNDIVMLAGGGALMYQDWIMRISPDGTLRHASTGAATSWTGAGGCECKERCVHLSHECRVVWIDGVQRVLTEQSTYKESPFGEEGVEIDGKLARPDLLYGYKLMLWDGEGEGTEHWTELVDLTDAFERFPRRMMQFPLADMAEGLEAQKCGAADEDRTLRTANLYHVSSADVLGDVVVATLRNTNALIGLDRTTGDVSWVVASPGALATDDDAALALGGADAAGGASPAAPQPEAFYEPHSAKVRARRAVGYLEGRALLATASGNDTFSLLPRAQFRSRAAPQLLSSDRVLLVDDGSTRRSCRGGKDADDDAKCFSRALELNLDREGHEATVEREFEFPLKDRDYAFGSDALGKVEASDIYNYIGGSFWPIDASLERYVVSMTSTVGEPYYFWEVELGGDDENGMTVTAMLETAHGHGLGAEGTYRATPVSTIDGEGHQPTVTIR